MHLRSWTETFASPIARRLNQAAPGADLLPIDIVYLFSLCAFEYAVNRRIANFCHLFSEIEWQDWNYWWDLEKYVLISGCKSDDAKSKLMTGTTSRAQEIRSVQLKASAGSMSSCRD